MILKILMKIFFVDEDKQEAAAEKEALQPSEDSEADDKLDIEEVE